MSEREGVAVVGLGRVGLPLALFLAGRGEDVHGVEVDADRVATLRDGTLPILEEGGAEALESTLGRTFRPTTDPGVVAGVETVILTPGTPVDAHLHPSFEQLESCLADIAPHLRAGQAVFLRSTVSPGTTERVGRWLAGRTGLEVGDELALAYCPERIAAGRALRELARIPQIVGADDDASRDRARAFFERFVPCHPADAVSAELAKLFSNVHRYVRFAIANELLMVAADHGAEFHEVRRLVNDGYPRGDIPSAGLTGGPCLRKDGFFLLSGTPSVELFTAAWRIHEAVPAFLVDRVLRELPDLEGRTAAVLGRTYKRDIDDRRDALSDRLAAVLRGKGARVLLHDPHVPSDPLEDCLASADVVFLAVDHATYRELDRADLARRTPEGCLVCDVWNVLGTDALVFPA